ncbi:hypothetical protein BDA96_04G029800 [Sorghum bicolor]|uniref:Uncharacterized protein n=1 Tax=Sorghum bicolor TaxID=4558 RepID=A0A921R031_SORBI|nr:hypothetical protein BDA96_04G029800 [Sorghum bicolor]
MPRGLAHNGRLRRERHWTVEGRQGGGATLANPSLTSCGPMAPSTCAPVVSIDSSIGQGPGAGVGGAGSASVSSNRGRGIAGWWQGSSRGRAPEKEIKGARL